MEVARLDDTDAVVTMTSQMHFSGPWDRSATGVGYNNMLRTPPDIGSFKKLHEGDRKVPHKENLIQIEYAI